MPAGELEGRQLTGAYPSQDGSIADTATPGDKTDRNIFRSPLPSYFLQVNLLLAVILLAEVFPGKLALLALVALVVFDIFEVYELFITEISHDRGENSQKNHVIKNVKGSDDS
jgi:hypothetical protein